MDKKLIGLLPAIKLAFGTLWDNNRLGFITKCFISVSVIVGVVIGVVYAISMTISIISALTSAPKNYSPTTDLNSVMYEENATVNHTDSPASLVLVTIASVAVGIVQFLATTFLATALLYIAVLAHQNKTVGVKEFLDMTKRKFLSIFVLSILLMLIIGFGYLLLIIPGIIFTIKYMFAPYIMLAEDKGIGESMKRSSQLTSGFRFNLFLKGLGFMLLAMAAIVPLLLLIVASGFAVVPYLNMFQSFVLLEIYKDLKRIKDSPAANVAAPSAPAPQVGTIAAN